jgi:DDE superfamily endonuclease
MEPPDALHDFRRSFYECFHRRSDALFELTDAFLGTDAAAPSPVHLSLRPAHRRGWGSFYAALTHGRIDAEVLRELLVRHPLSGSAETPVYAVDTSVWPRCDAETSPQRGYYYHPSRHSAGQPIIAGWAYQFVAQLNFVRESWTAPMDVERVLPAQDANVVASEQVKALLERLGKGRTAFPCSSSMRAMTPSRCSRDWRGARARSSYVCERGDASTAIRACATRRRTSDALVATGPR